MGTKFKVFFSGYLKELYAQLGMAMNEFIRKAVASEQKIQSAFLQEAETIDVDKLKDEMLLRIGKLRFCKPGNSLNFEDVMRETRERFGPELDDWIEENKELIAEIQFLGEPYKVE